MVQKRSFMLLFLSIFLGACGNSNVASTTQSAQESTARQSSLAIGSDKIVVSTSDLDYNVFAANLGQSDIKTYAISVNNYNAQKYSITTSGLSNGLTELSNTCQNVNASQKCNIAIAFNPTDVRHFATGNKINFNLSSSLVAASAQTNTESATLSANTTTATVSLQTFDVNATATNASKTGVMVSVGGGVPTLALLDTGSQLTVVDKAVAGNDLNVTDQTASISYGEGTGYTVSGNIAYGTLTFNTANGATITTSPNTPILLATSGTVSPKGYFNVILGVRLNTQASFRLFLPSPYNRLMILNRSKNDLTFGKLSSDQYQNFATIGLPQATSCENSKFTLSSSVKCWNSAAMQVNYSYKNGSSTGSATYDTLMDTGAATTILTLNEKPSWAQVASSYIENITGATLSTDKGSIPIQLINPTLHVREKDKSLGDIVNVGNAVFNYYQVSYDHINGKIGFLDANSSY